MNTTEGREGEKLDGGDRGRGTRRRGERARNTTEGIEGEEHDGGERG